MRIHQFPWKVICVMLIVYGTLITTARSSELAENYINNFKDIAISEMYRTGVPASIKLAQGLLESNWGRSTLSKKANNHFGIKCGPKWDGGKIYMKDDDYNSRGDLINSCFRKYKSVQESYIAHSEFLIDPKKKHRYGFLFSIPSDDYKAWARGLYKAGYATDPRYASKLIQIIEQYELHKFDRADVLVMGTSDGSSDMEGINHAAESQTKFKGNRNYVNGLVVMYPDDGESLGEFAERTNLSIATIKVYNEKIGNKSTILAADMPIYLSPKKGKYLGNKAEHRVRRGEKMFEISQKYGIKLENLYAFNRMPSDSEPLPGEMILLNSFAQWGKRPKFKERSENQNTMDEELLFEDIDFESGHMRNSK